LLTWLVGRPEWVLDDAEERAESEVVLRRVENDQIVVEQTARVGPPSADDGVESP
jgi:hypothetical protein